MVSLSDRIEEIHEILREIPDPEIPVLTLSDLGIIKDVSISGNEVQVTITPTYTGCPAMKVFEEDIISALREAGFENVKIKTRLSPAWTTDWMSEEGRNKLRAYGIAPPVGSSDKSQLQLQKRVIQCPQCRSMNTEIISQFGSTPCKSLYRCEDCKEPFDYFKCI